MACNHRHGGIDDIESPCDKCKNAEEKCQLFLKTAVDRQADRHRDLDYRQRLLGDKIDLMERSIPALIALGMFRAEETGSSAEAPGTEAAALERVRELMRKLSPLPDPADELAAELAATVDQLNRETAELHDKIINADVELEETCMELESLELANCELEAQIGRLETKLAAQPSLKSITSDDRVCLARIRHLVDTELRAKRCIRELEEREVALRSQIERILGPSDGKRLCEATNASDRQGHGGRHHAHRRRKKEECQQLNTSIESIFERDKNCNIAGCSTLKKMIEEKKSMVCKCNKKHKIKSSRKTSESCEHFAHKSCCTCRSRKKSEKSTCRQLCNCTDSLKSDCQQKIEESSVSPQHTLDANSIPIIKTEINKPEDIIEDFTTFDGTIGSHGYIVQEKQSNIQIEVKISHIETELNTEGYSTNENKKFEASEKVSIQ